VTGLVALRQQALGLRMLADLQRLTGVAGAQAYCLECGAQAGQGGAAAAPTGWLALLLRHL
jgi:protease-4